MAIAPDIQGNQWLNCEKLSLNDFLGSVVVMIFWSFGCEASQERLRQLAEVQKAVGDSLVVIGIHSPRFEYEKDSVSVTQALVQHNINIPVIHDTQYQNWNNYNPEGWPATVVVGSDGTIIGRQAGSGDISVVLEAILSGLDETNEEDATKNIQYKTASESENSVGYLTKVSANANNKLVYNDPAAGTVTIVNLSERLDIGTKIRVLDNFKYPSSVLITDDDDIYITDSYNGSLTKYNLESQELSVLTKDLIAPSGITQDFDSSLVISDGGADQIMRVIENYDSESETGPIAGIGLTGCEDGNANVAELAQPSGLVRTEVGIVFCDAASSKLRMLTDNSKINTLNGVCDFSWGFNDGTAENTLFQRPSDVCTDKDGALVIVDTGNHVLRKLSRREFKTLNISNLNRPEGICSLPSGHLIVANTGNQEILVIDPSGKSVWPLEIVE